MLCWNLFCFRERVPAPKKENGSHNHDIENRSIASLVTTLESPPTSQHEGSDYRNGTSQTGYSARSLLKSASISASKCIGMKPRNKSEVKYQEALDEMYYIVQVCLHLFFRFLSFLQYGESNNDTVDALSQKVAALHTWLVSEIEDWNLLLTVDGWFYKSCTHLSEKTKKKSDLDRDIERHDSWAMNKTT